MYAPLCNQQIYIERTLYRLAAITELGKLPKTRRNHRASMNSLAIPQRNLMTRARQFGAESYSNFPSWWWEFFHRGDNTFNQFPRNGRWLLWEPWYLRNKEKPSLFDRDKSPLHFSVRAPHPPFAFAWRPPAVAPDFFPCDSRGW